MSLSKFLRIFRTWKESLFRYSARALVPGPVRGLTRGRVLALFLGGFSLLNLVGEFLAPGFDSNIWWIDLRVLPNPLGDILLFSGSLCLLKFAWRPGVSRNGAYFIFITLSLLLIFIVINVITYYVLLSSGPLFAGFPAPFSLLIALAMGYVLYVFWKSKLWKKGGQDVTVDYKLERPELISAGILFLITLVLFPLAQIFCYGKTDYRRPAQAAVVFGARVYADGSLSQALRDRTRTAVELYRQGLVARLIFSGGPGDGKIHETEAMRNFSIRRGVRPEHIILDKEGLDTRRTAENTVALFRRYRYRRVLAVSHFFHLPRIKMAYKRAGFEIYTVPAKETYILKSMPYLIMRETAALWFYYLRPILGV